MEEKKQILGIDLGTTYSCVAVVNEYGQPQVLVNREGKLTTPSVVSFEDENAVDLLVGEHAKNRWHSAPEQTVSFIKRHMTKDESFTNPEKFPHGWDPVKFSAAILKKLVTDANETLGREENPIKDVVITCPAYFGHVARERTKQAGKEAGLNVLDIIDEPTAAAISYGIKQDQDQTVLVYDLGGGTFDVTILKITGNTFEVIATEGDPVCGGYDWDEELAKRILDIYNEKHHTDFKFPLSKDEALEDKTLKADPKIQRMRASLLMEAERLKIALNTSKTRSAETTWLFEEDGRSCPRSVITRKEFDDLTSAHLSYTIGYVHKVIQEAEKKGVNHIDKWILVGGSSRMLQVKERFDEEFGCNAMLTDPDHCVAKGAAIYAATEFAGTGPLRNGKTINIKTVCTKTYGTDISDDGVKKVRNLIFANTTLPIDETVDFRTVYDGQREVSMEIYESNVTDARCTVIPIPPARLINKDNFLKIKSDLPAGSKISVTFHFDQTGFIHVSAKAEDGSVCEFELKADGLKSEDELARDKKLIERATEKNI